MFTYRTLLASLLIVTGSILRAEAQQPQPEGSPTDSINYREWLRSRISDSTAYALPEYGYQVPKKPWRAAAEVFTINAGVWAFDHYVKKDDFAEISFQTVWNNIKSGFLWDNDQFITNLFAHPYHGGLYFNSARANGMSFWQSIPYAFAGSMMWEIAAENNPPALNDLFATTIGGVALGEVTNRIALLPLDDRKRGWGRFWRELLTTAVSPMRGLNRILSGDAWRTRQERYLYHDYQRLPVHLSIGLGDRYIADDNSLFRGEHAPFVNIGLTYGDAFDYSENRPYDYFTLNLTSNFTSNQPLLSEVNLRGKLYGQPFETSSDLEVLVGVFQHFNYYDSEPVIDGTNFVPFKISEAASIGGGALIRFPSSPSRGMGLEQQLHASVVLLGGSLSDHYQVIDRNYNLGSGFSLHSDTRVQLGARANLLLQLQHLQLFTWKGYTMDKLGRVDPLYLNAQGDKGNTRLTIFRSKFTTDLTQHLSLGLDLQYYWRGTHYVEYEDVRFRTFETRLGLYYSL